MVVKTLMEEAKSILIDAGLDERDCKIEIARSPEYGELTCTSIFEISKRVKEDPMRLAMKLTDTLNKIIQAREGIIESAVAVKPGYINFYVDWRKYSSLILREVLEKAELYGSSNIGNGKKVLIEHTSVNPNKPLHVGHARNVCLGDTLARLFKFLGYDVVIVNYIDDSGSQMVDIVFGIKCLGYSLMPPNGIRMDEYFGDIYTEVNKRLESEKSLEEKKKALLKEIEDVNSEVFKLAREIAQRVLMEQLRTCWRLGASYDLLHRESDVIGCGLWNDIFKKLREKGAIYIASDGPKVGCWLIDLSKHEKLSKEGDEVLVKSDGTTTYVARDIAYAAWKLGISEKDFRYVKLGRNPDGSEIYITDLNGDVELKIGKVDKAITVVDVRQRRPQEIVRYALGILGANPEHYIHFAYEVVALSRREVERMGISLDSASFIHMKGREGLYVKVESILDSLRDRIVRETAQRHQDWSDEKIRDVAEKVAVGALRYALIKSDADKIIVFDSEEASRIEGDTGPYLQYTYARACRILEKVVDLDLNVYEKHPLEKDEINLLREISYFPMVVEESAKFFLIKKLANYAYNLASYFNNFYERCPVLSSKEDVMKFRVNLVRAFKQTMENCLRILGIPILSEM